MQREIIFRGKLVGTNDYVYGSLIKSLKEEKYKITEGFFTVGEYGEQQFANDVDIDSIGQYTEQNDYDGNPIYEKMIVHQQSVLLGSPYVGFTGEVKFYDGSWCIDNGVDSVLLFDESNENHIMED